MSVAQSHDHQRVTRNAKLIAAHCRNRFAVGDHQPFVETIEKLARHATQHDHVLRQALTPLMEACSESLLQDGGSWSPKQCAAVGQALRGVLTNQGQFYVQNFRRFSTILLVTHARADQTKQLRQWYEQLSEQYHGWMRHQRVEPQLWEYGKKLFPDPGDEDRDARVQYVRNLLQCAIDIKRMTFNQHRPFRIQGAGNETVFVHAVKANLLRAEEMPQLVQSLVESDESQGQITAALAHWFHDQRKFETAATVWEKAAAATPEDQHQRRAYSQLHWAIALSELGKIESAAKTLSDVQLKHLPGNKQHHYRNLKKKLDDMAKQNADAPAPANKQKPEPITDKNVTWSTTNKKRSTQAA